MSSASSTMPAPTVDAHQECLSCRIIGTGALGAVGLYALNQSRQHQPGSVLGKRIVAGLGICFLAASYGRWNATKIGLLGSNESKT